MKRKRHERSGEREQKEVGATGRNKEEMRRIRVSKSQARKNDEELHENMGRFLRQIGAYIKIKYKKF